MKNCPDCGKPISDEIEKRQKCCCPKTEEGQDFYLENGFLVFTEEYHLKRGYCCGSGCRHCPYKSTPKE